MIVKNRETGELKELPDGFICGDNLINFLKHWEVLEV